jgi:hypothetical protein
MHDAAGNQRLTTQSVLHIRAQLTNPSSAMIDAIGTGIGSKDWTLQLCSRRDKQF